MDNPLCYYVKVLGTDNAAFEYYLQANNSTNKVTLARLEKAKPRPTDDNSILWVPVTFMTNNNEGFVLQNAGSGKIIATTGARLPVTLVGRNEITRLNSTWSLMDAGMGVDKYLQSPLTDPGSKTSLVLNVKGSVYFPGGGDNATLLAWPIDNPSGTDNEVWRFIKLGAPGGE